MQREMCKCIKMIKSTLWTIMYNFVQKNFGYEYKFVRLDHFCEHGIS